MRKKIIISSVLLLCVIVLMMLWVSSRGKQSTEPSNSTQQEVTFPNTNEGEGAAVVPSADWEFLNDPNLVDATVDGWEGYVIGSEVTAEGNVFEIYYSVPDDSFFITLESLPLGFSRERAEQVLSETLNRLPSELCELRISVSVAYDVDQNLAGQNLGLSMCSGSVAL